MSAGSRVSDPANAIVMVTASAGPTVKNTPSVANVRARNVSATVPAEPVITSPMVAIATTTASSDAIPLRMHSWYRLNRKTA